MNLNNQKYYSVKQKITNLLVLFFIFLGALIYFAIIPSIAAINDLETQIINEKINAEKKYRTKNNTIGLNKKINELATDIKSLDEVFINKNRELEFITILENIANKNNVSQKINLTSPSDAQAIKTVKKGKSTDKEPADDGSSAPLMMTVSGNYKNILNYLTEINSLKYYITIDGLDFSQGSIDNSLLNNNLNHNQIITLNINAKTYWK